MKLNHFNLPRIIDISCVRPGVGQNELEKMVLLAEEYSFIMCLALPYYTPFLISKLKDNPRVKVGCVAGFPSGGNTTGIKALEAKEQIALGCTDIDMVVNIGELKSKHIEAVYEDIKAVVAAADGATVKAILEVTLLDDDEIRFGAEAAVRAGAGFVKTGTGWTGIPTTVRHIELIRDTIGDAALIKAAGGVRTLDDIVDMTNAGCSRFGMGVGVIESLMHELGERAPECRDIVIL